ncbi:MAG: flavodoxin domain-containing protein [Candidatus Omnitrophica bacterium]|nr:flavodoxin domain-containing protein [Candidatus Omnitrophota bacterium]
MRPVEIKKGVYWVGVVDWNIRTFHGNTYSTKRGTTYNSYLIIDEKVTLIDGVPGSFAGEQIGRIREIVPVEKIDYIVVNHIEPDHSGGLPELMKLCPKAKLFGTAKSKEGLARMYYTDWGLQAVKTGDKLNIGKRNLTFIEAPMIHWPDSMFTYCAEEELLLPNDAFGQHYATSERFDDETDQCALMDEAAKYYANILWPLGGMIARKIDEILKMGISIKMIAPSHGIIWRRDPMKIINSYVSWTKNETKPKAVVIFETMWGSTDMMARKITEGLTDGGIEVKLFDITRSDRSEVNNQMLDAKCFVFGSSTHDNGMLSTMAGFLEFLNGLKPKGRIGAAFGSYGWAGGAVPSLEQALKETGIEQALPSIAVKYVPDENELKRCYEMGVELAKKITGKA